MTRSANGWGSDGARWEGAGELIDPLRSREVLVPHRLVQEIHPGSIRERLACPRGLAGPSRAEQEEAPLRCLESAPDKSLRTAQNAPSEFVLTVIFNMAPALMGSPPAASTLDRQVSCAVQPAG